MSPMISGSKKDNIKLRFIKNQITKKKKLLKLRQYVEKNFEYVGDKFSKK